MEHLTMELFRKFAKETLCRINKGEGLTAIFENQPKWCNGSVEMVRPQEWIIGATTTSSTYVDIKYRSDVSNMNHKKVVGFFENYMLPNIMKAAASHSNNNNNKMSYVKEAVKHTIAHDIEGRDIQWQPTQEQTRDVCLTLPLNDVEGNEVQIRFNF